MKDEKATAWISVTEPVRDAKFDCEDLSVGLRTSLRIVDAFQTL